MGTILLIQSIATKEVKPNIVELSIYISEKDKDAKEVIRKINNKKETTKYYIMDRISYKKDSYKQSTINFRKVTNQEEYYTDGKHMISRKEYSNLSGQKQQAYTITHKETLLYYEASLNISASLTYEENATNEKATVDQVIQDFTNIYNMSIENNYKCRYNQTISKEMSETIQNDLYVDCINKGMAKVIYIAKGVADFKPDGIKLLQINETSTYDNPINNNYSMRKAATKLSLDSSYTPEQYMMPELIADVFDNKLTISKSLDLKFEI